MKALNEQSLMLQEAVQCAPVLAGIKASNLLVLDQSMPPRNVCTLHDPELYCRHLYRLGSKRIWLIYRQTEIERILQDPANRDFLRNFGYEDFAPDAVMLRLRRHCQAYAAGLQGFPHELGLFLDYPLGDVIGFLQNHGKNYLLSGYWKVYTDTDKAQKTFENYRRVKKQAEYYAREGRAFREIVDVFRTRRSACIA